MARVDLVNVEVLSNPSAFVDDFQFRITFECNEPLEDDLEWKLVYVGCAYTEDLDQVLDTVLVGPVPVGLHRFVFSAGAPDTSRIPKSEAIGATVILIQAFYRDKEFLRAGYYVNNEYNTEEMKDNPPEEPDFSQMTRNILASSPRVTRFPIDWGDGVIETTENTDDCENTSNDADHDVDEMSRIGIGMQPLLEQKINGINEKSFNGEEHRGVPIATANL